MCCPSKTWKQTGGEAGVAPAISNLVLDEPGQLALGHGGIDEAKAAVVPNFGSTELEHIQQPLVLRKIEGLKKQTARKRLTC